MKLEVGMYVRTKRRTLQPPQIARIRNISKDSGYKNQCYIELDKNLIPNYEYHIYREDVLKASHNIIDLIQDGDIYYYIAHDEWDYGSSDYEDVGILCEEDRYFVEGLLEENRLISVVTKEQFESMSYKVGD